MKTQNDLLAEKFAELADELLQLEDNFRDNQYIKNRLSAARDNLDDAHSALKQLDFNVLASNSKAEETSKS
jgi:hypothetical protein